MSPATGELVSHIQKCIAGGQLSEAEKLLLGYLSASQSRSTVHEQWAKLVCDLIAAYNSKSNFARALKTLDKALDESHESLQGPYLEFANHLAKAATSYRRNAPQHATHLLRQSMSIQHKFRSPQMFSTFQQLGAIYHSHVASLQKRNLKSEAKDTLSEFQSIAQSWIQAANQNGNEIALAEAYTYMSASCELLNNKSEAKSAFQKALSAYGTAVNKGDLENTEAFHVFLQTADTLNYPGNSRKGVEVIKDKSRRVTSKQSSSFPSTEQLSEMLQQAKRKNAPTSLSFAGMQSGSEFLLSCHVDDLKEADPEWEICVRQNGQTSVLEVARTNDIAKVHSRLRQAWKRTMPSLTKIELVNAPIPPEPESVQRSMQEPATPMLEGTLETISVSTLLQSLSLERKTGRLQVMGPRGLFEVHFNDGDLVHAVAERSEPGEHAVFDLLLECEGNFRFLPDDGRSLPAKPTINVSLHKFLLEGASLKDQFETLNAWGLCEGTVMRIVNNSITPSELVASVLTHCDEETVPHCLDIYKAVKAGSSSVEAISKLNIPSRRRIPALHALLKADQLRIEQPKEERTDMLFHWKCDRALIDQAQERMRDATTGLVSYPFFLLFLDQEFERARLLSSSLSLAILELTPTSNPSNRNDLSKALETLRASARKTDYVCSFEDNQYAVIMPATNTETAELILTRVGQILARLKGIDLVTFGVATSPSDTVKLESLVSCAQEAKRHARFVKQHVFSFANLRKE